MGLICWIRFGARPATSTASLKEPAPTKYETNHHLKTTKALGITVLPTLLARADEMVD
jgi:hypothetical protein